MANDLKQLQEKWAPVLNHDALPEIEDYPQARRCSHDSLKGSREKALVTEEGGILSETLQTTGYTGGDTATGACCWFLDPVLISLIRRSMSNWIACDIIGTHRTSGSKRSVQDRNQQQSYQL